MKKLFCQQNMNKFLKLTQCYDQRYDQTFAMELHAHEGVELMYVHDGEMDFVYENDGVKEVWHIGIDEFVFFDSTFPHYIVIKSATARIFNFQVKVFDEKIYPFQQNLSALVSIDVIYQILLQDGNSVFKLYDSKGILFTLKKLVEMAHIYCDTNYVVVDLLLKTILFEIANAHYCQEKTYRGFSYVKKAIRIFDNSSKRLSAAELAERVGISYIYLHKLFKVCFQKGIVEYFNCERIERACKTIVKHPNLGIKEIVSMCGFSGIRQFERQFKNVKGITPTKYKADINDSKLFYLYQ